MAHETILGQISETLIAARESQEFVLVAIDGAGGAGKSSFAGDLARVTDAVIIEGDDFYRVMNEGERSDLDAYGGYLKYFDWQRLRDQVLRPINEGIIASYDRYEWCSNALSGRAEVEPAGIIIVEGVYSFRPELRGYYDFSILVETPRSERLNRLRARGQNSETWIQRWDAAECWYFENIFARSEVDFVLSGSSAG